jgi:D-lactate dehydrogenase
MLGPEGWERENQIMKEVFFFEAFAEEADKLRHYLPFGADVGYTAATIQEYGLTEPPSRVISVRTQSVIPADWISQLDAVLTRSTGYDHLLWIQEAENKLLRLGHLPVYCARAVAEQAMLFWMTLLRRLPAQRRAFQSFHRDGLTGREARGRRLAVIGVGRIGIETVDLGRSLGMEVTGVDLVEKHPTVTYASAEEALTSADIIVAAMNLTELNNGYFTRKRLGLCARGAIFINVSRGELSPAPLLLDLLTEGQLGGVGLDVYDGESRLAVALRSGGNLDELDDLDEVTRAVIDLNKRDDVILTPHNAFNTSEAVDRKSIQSVEQLRHLKENGEFLWPVPTR